MKIKNNKAILPIIFYFMMIVGACGFRMNIFDTLINWSTPLILITSSFLVLISLAQHNGKKFIQWAYLLYLITMGAEIVGVKTGLLFGEYTYSTSLGIKIFETPLVIGFNWLIVILGSISLSKKLKSSMLLHAFCAGAIGTLFDVIMEIAVLRVGFWRFSSGLPPAENYIMWFLLVFLGSLLFRIYKLEIQTSLTTHLFLSYLLFFLIIAI